LPVDKATIESLRAQKEAADEAARLATINLGRVTPLTKDGFASKQTYDNTLTTQQQSVAQQRNAKATLEREKQTLQLHQVAVATARAARLYAEWRLSRTDVTAPVDGQITNLRLASGDYVSPGGPALAIVDASAWRVIAGSACRGIAGNACRAVSACRDCTRLITSAATRLARINPAPAI